MLARLKMFWIAVRDSLWFIPTLLTLLASALAIILVQIEVTFDLDGLDEGRWLVGGGAEGARSVLSTIAGSLITVTGVVFSITIVALQLASSQFTPRVLRNFLADRSNQLVLGVFIATFTYTLLVLRVIRSGDEHQNFVPQLSVAVAIILALVCIGFLIHFIHHAGRSIQAAVILDKITIEALQKIKKLFPTEIGKPDSRPLCGDDMPQGIAEVIRSQHEGYLQAVDGKSLFQLGERQSLVVQMIPAVGEFLIRGMPLAHAWAEQPLAEQTHKAIQAAFLLGDQRSPEQDLEFFLIEIADIAIKALSPGINDPTTAYLCIDRLTQILLALGQREFPAPRRTKTGRVHFIACPTTFAQAVEISFSQILHYGRDHPAMRRKLQQSLQLLQQLLPVERHGVLEQTLVKIDEIERSQHGDLQPSMKAGDLPAIAPAPAADQDVTG